MVEQPALLDVTRATDFIPGTNVKGEVAGGNWLFLLPSLALGQVLCVGTPQLSTLATLSQLSNRVVVVDQVAGAYGFTNVISHQIAGFEQLPSLDGEFNLIVIAAQEQVRNLKRSQGLQSALLGVSSSQTRFYWEEYPPLQRQAKGKLPLGEPHYYWLTPLQGEAVTAVPLEDRQTTDFFLERKLFSPSVKRRLFAPIKRKFVKSASSSAKPTGVSSSSGKSSKRFRAKLKRRFRRVARTTGITVLARFEQAEQTLHQHTSLLTRCGVLVSPVEEAANGALSPPRYLRELASNEGLDITSHRWGVVASGEYSSRKVLCFLFPRKSPTPDYIVKIVRNPRFNPRLENEVRGLRLLDQSNRMDADTIPRVVFSGHHAGLAMVGESYIEGVPFQLRSTYREDCPFVNTAIDWITRLGKSNGTSITTHTDDLFNTLTQLFLRFKWIYPLESSESSFLQKQLDQLRDLDTQLPAVFQHGDPGTWNMLVRENGKIAVLDWEAAEPTGIPLWDLLYFLRSFAAGAAKKEGVTDRVQAFRQNFLEERGLNQFITQSIGRYTERIGLPSGLAEPLFYTCWMHRALKESTLLTSANLAKGYYFNVLRLCIRQQDSVVAHHLFSR